MTDLRTSWKVGHPLILTFVRQSRRLKLLIVITRPIFMSTSRAFSLRNDFRSISGHEEMIAVGEELKDYTYMMRHQPTHFAVSPGTPGNCGLADIVQDIIIIHSRYIASQQPNLTVSWEQARRQGVAARGQLPPCGFGLPPPPFFFCLSAQSRTVMMIIPLPHYGNNFASPPPPPRWAPFQGWRSAQRDIFQPPPPLQANTLAPPLLERVCIWYNLQALFCIKNECIASLLS